MFQEEVWVAGGLKDMDLNVVEILNLGTATWRKGPSLVTPRWYLTMGTVENSLVVFGGEGGPTTMEKLAGGEWIEEPMQQRHSIHASVILPCPTNGN